MMYDTDRSGFIEFNEYFQALQYLRVPVSREDAWAMFNLVDIDHNGRIALDEFVQYYIANY